MTKKTKTQDAGWRPFGTRHQRTGWETTSAETDGGQTKVVHGCSVVAADGRSWRLLVERAYSSRAWTVEIRPGRYGEPHVYVWEVPTDFAARETALRLVKVL